MQNTLLNINKEISNIKSDIKQNQDTINNLMKNYNEIKKDIKKKNNNNNIHFRYR